MSELKLGVAVAFGAFFGAVCGQVAVFLLYTFIMLIIRLV